MQGKWLTEKVALSKPQSICVPFIEPKIQLWTVMVIELEVAGLLLRHG